MVLRETGAGWLASMMRAERRPEESLTPEIDILEALERLTSAPPLGELSRSD